MTHFRFRYKRVGYMRWRCRTAQRRTTPLVPSLIVAAQYDASITAAWRRTMPVFAPVFPTAMELRVGDFIVSEAGDPQLLGHPDIRY